jgi:hypothetical protein
MTTEVAVQAVVLSLIPSSSITPTPTASQMASLPSYTTFKLWKTRCRSYSSAWAKHNNNYITWRKRNYPHLSLTQCWEHWQQHTQTMTTQGGRGQRTDLM